MANKSLIDNPLADMDLGNLNGFTMSDLSQFNQATSEKELKETMQNDLNAMIKDKLNKSVSDEEKDILKQLVDTHKAEQEINKLKDDLIVSDEATLLKEQEELKAKLEQHEQVKNKVSDNTNDKKPKTTYTKKTYIIKDEYIEIIEGLHLVKDVEVKDVVNQLLEQALKTLDETTLTKAQKEGRKSLMSKKNNNNKSIF